MTEEIVIEDTETKKKGGFFRKLMKLAFIAAIVSAVEAIVKHRKDDQLHHVKSQELPPPAGG